MESLISKKYLPRHDGLGGQMDHATDCAAIAGPNLLQRLQVLAPEIQLELDAQLEVWQRFSSGIVSCSCGCSLCCHAPCHGQVVHMGTPAWRRTLICGLVQGQVLEVSLFADRTRRNHDEMR